MKQLRITTICLAFGIAALAAAQGNTKSALTALYAKMDALSLKKDGEGLKKMMSATATKDFFFTDETHKKQSLKDIMRDMSAQLGKMSRVRKSSTHIDAIVEKDGTATVSISSVLAFTEEGHEFVLNSKAKDVWVKSGRTWKMKSSTELKQSGTQDGKPVKLGG